MNQILDKKGKVQTTFNIEFSNDIFEIPYDEYLNEFKPIKNFGLKKYKVQFFFSCLVSLIVCIIFLFNLLKSRNQEKLSKNLLNSYNLTTLYQSHSINSISSYSSPFVIGILKIDKINLNYPILSQTNDELLKISLCKFAGPMPNEIGNLCIVGHNYIDNRFFSRLNELITGDEIEIYDLTRNSKYL